MLALQAAFCLFGFAFTQNFMECHLNCPYLYLLLALIILVLCKASRSYINITDILLNYNEKILKAHRLKLLFVVFPILLSMSINIVKLIDKDIIDSITLSVSILISMFFAYIAFFDEYKISNIDDASIKKILEKTNFESNIIVSYEIFISIMLLIICMIYPIIGVNDIKLIKIDEYFISIKSIYSLIIYSLFIHMLMNLLILLKRYNVLKKYK